MNNRHVALITVAAAVVASALPLHAQIRGSERSLVTQTVDGTTISVDYGRPHARGRLPVFGTIVDWGHLWTPGANWATTFDFSRDVEINGVAVPEGKYSVWMIADPEEWRIFLDPTDSLFHTIRPEISEEQIRISATPQEVPHVEALTFSFPKVRSDGTDLTFAWGSISVVMRVDVQATQRLTMEADAAAPFVGVYDVAWKGPPMDEIPDAERIGVNSRIALTFAEDRLTGVWTNFFVNQGPSEVMMLPVAGPVFHPGWMQNGELVETDPGIFVEFTVEDGIATGFQMRDGDSDMLLWQGTRVEQSGDLRIARALLAAPAQFREGAEVREWNAEGVLVTIREGSGVICIADRPGNGTFQAACYHESLEPFMAKGRELSASGVEGMERQEARWAEVEAGRLKMPETAAMVFNLSFATETFDPATTDPATGGRLHAMYLPYMTPESTGLPLAPTGGSPWLMWPGRPSSHVMVALPAKGPG